MPTVTVATSPTAYTVGKPYYYVYAKRFWSGTWQYLPHVQPIYSDDQTCPSVGSAAFYFDFGNRNFEGTSTFTVMYPYQLRNYYCRIDVQYPGEQPFTTWVGVLVDDKFTVNNPLVPTGVQTMKAYSFAHLLDRIIINFAVTTTGDLTTYHTTQTCPTFNYAAKSRGPDHAIVGNRSTSRISNSFLFSGGVNSAYVFQNNSGNLWTFEDIANYLLAFFKPGGQTWYLGGNVEALRQCKEVVNLEGKSVWTALNMLISRKRGLGFAIRPQPNSSFVMVDIFTETSRPIQVRGAYLPANYKQVFFQIPDTAPYTHYLGDIDFTVTASHQYDRILIRGRPAMCTAYFSYKHNGIDYAESPITEGWTSAIETSYCSDLTGDSDKNDRIRGSDLYESVFAHHIVKTNWTGFIRQYDTGVYYSTVPLVDNLGGVTLNESPYPPYIGDMRFQRHTAFKEGWDYTVSPAAPFTDFIVTTTTPEYTPLLAFVRIPDPDNSGQFIECLANKIHDFNEDYTSASVRSLDDKFGISVRWDPNHLVADTSIIESNVDPVDDFDYRDISFVGMFETEFMPTINLVNFFSTYSDTLRTFTFDVSADFWFCPPNTPFEMDEDGGLYTVHPDNTILRDERYLLYVAAAFAVGWYGVFRQAVTIPIQKIVHLFDVGSTMRDIRTVYAREQVESTITGRRINYLTGETVFTTSYQEIDLKEFVDSAAFGTEHYD